MRRRRNWAPEQIAFVDETALVNPIPDSHAGGAGDSIDSREKIVMMTFP
jgi:hypothetical protein